MAQAMRLLSLITGCIIPLLCNLAIADNNGGGAFSNWPDTGQTTCYDTAGNVLDPCPSEGQPFYGQDAQYQGPTRSYAKLDASGNNLPDSATSWLMVRDNVTGLIWEVKQLKDGVDNYSNPNDADNTYTWCDPHPETNGGDQGICSDYNTDSFIQALNTTKFGGYDDWRLPTIKELSTLVNGGRDNPAINTDYFPSTISYGYWTSTSHSNSNFVGYAGIVLFANGYASHGYAKSINHNVRAVRGTIYQNPSQFIVNGNGTVIDTTTGLMWQQTTADSNNDANPDEMNWQLSLSYCENLELGGYNDWRLPDRNELQSLVDYGRYYPAINIVAFPDTMSSIYNSSTSYVSYDGYTWLINFSYGGVSQSYKSNNHYVRCVRRGQNGTPDASPIIAQTPMSGSRGITFFQWGMNFTPNDYVILHFQKPDGSEYPTLQLTLDASGYFETNYTAPGEKPAGVYTWWAIDDSTGVTSNKISYEVTAFTEPVEPILTPTTAQKAVFITHGWNGEADTVDDWAVDMQNMIKLNVNTDEWHVEAYDWKGAAATSVVPTAAYYNPGTIGRAIGRLYCAKNFSHIHFIAHSAGSNMIHQASKYIQNNCVGNLKIHNTFLDAYSPAGNLSSYGKYTDWADNYVDKRPLAGLFMKYSGVGFLDTTDSYFQNTYNFDVTPIASFSVNPIVRHAWPYHFYRETIDYSGGNSCHSNAGFNLSLEGGNTSGWASDASSINSQLPVGDDYSCGSTARIMATSSYLFAKNSTPAITTKYGIPINFVVADNNQKVTVNNASDVVINSDNITLTTNSNETWLSVELTTTDDVNIIKLNYQFLTLFKSLVTVYFNDTIIFEDSEAQALTNLYDEDDIWIGNVEPGKHKISFRLDSFSGQQSQVNISTVVLGKRYVNTSFPWPMFLPAITGGQQ